jgi:hypothetical protein
MTSAEADEVQRYATKDDVTTSEFGRGAVLTYLALRGSKLAWKCMGTGAVAIAQDLIGNASQEVATAR